MSDIRVFLVDDHYMVCEGLTRMLEREHDISVVGEAQSGEAALERLREIPADVVLLDVRLCGMDGIDTLRGLKQEHPGLKVIMLTSYGDQYLAESVDAGADGYLLKRANRAEMVKAIREAMDGGVPLDSLVTRGLFERLRNAVRWPVQELSPREGEALELAAGGLSNKQIASKLGVSVPTVKKRISNAMQQLGAHDRTHAVAIALRKGWISNPVSVDWS